jgi:hypothetical protein
VKRVLASLICLDLSGLFDLSALAFIGMASIGYQAGLAVTRRSPAMLLLVLAFAGVLFLIADLDRGLEGFLTVNQEAMTDLQRSIHSAQQEAQHPSFPRSASSASTRNIEKTRLPRRARAPVYCILSVSAPDHRTAMC